MRRGARVDDNQRAIVEALRNLGVSVQHLHEVGNGCPDLLLGWRGCNFLVELKDGRKAPSRRALTEDEQRWHREWRGAAAAVCESLDEVLRLLGVTPPPR